VRVRPILLTAAAIVFGESVLLLDPVMRGLGLTLISGAVAGTALTLVVVPAVYYELKIGTGRFEAWRQRRPA
jgi:multidrug efflux pump subunit AcrB